MEGERYDFNGPVDVGEAERLGEGGGKVSQNCETTVLDVRITNHQEETVYVPGGSADVRNRRNVYTNKTTW